jgi:hypothetical protein
MKIGLGLAAPPDFILKPLRPFKKETQKPTAFMMMTKIAAVIVVKGGTYRQLAQPFSAVQQSSLSALGVPATYFTVPPSR